MAMLLLLLLAIPARGEMTEVEKKYAVGDLVYAGACRVKMTTGEWGKAMCAVFQKDGYRNILLYDVDDTEASTLLVVMRENVATGEQTEIYNWRRANGKIAL